MKIKISRARCTHADGVNPRVPQTEQVVEDDRMQRITQLKQPLGWGVQMSPLIGGADDEHPHVLIPGCIQGRTVVLPDVIPVQIDVIEGTAVAGWR